VPRNNVFIAGYNPTGGDETMDEARVVDPYGCVGGRVRTRPTSPRRETQLTEKTEKQLAD